MFCFVIQSEFYLYVYLFNSHLLFSKSYLDIVRLGSTVEQCRTMSNVAEQCRTMANNWEQCQTMTNNDEVTCGGDLPTKIGRIPRALDLFITLWIIL